MEEEQAYRVVNCSHAKKITRPDRVKVGEALHRATFVVVCAGAGFSVDSGVAAYAQVDESEFLKSRGVSYRDVSSPDLLWKNKELFYAWADRCISTYRAAEPHHVRGKRCAFAELQGYSVLAEWRRKLEQRDAAVVARLREAMRAADMQNNALQGEIRAIAIAS